MKKTITLLLLVAAIFALTGCGDKKENTTKNNTVKSSTTKESNKRPSINEQVLVDKDGVKITATGLSYDSFWGYELKLLIENNTEQNLNFDIDYAVVNGFLMTPTLSGAVNAGKKANTSIYFDDSDLAMAKIEKIKDIDLNIIAYKADSFDEFAIYPPVRIQTDATDYVQKNNTEGTLILDESGIKIYAVRVDYDDTFGPEVIFYIENNTQKEIGVTSDDESVNGYMIDGLLITYVPAGIKAYDTMSFFSSDLKENNIDKIKELEFKLKVYDNDSFDYVIDGKEVKLNFN